MKKIMLFSLLALSFLGNGITAAAGNQAAAPELQLNDDCCPTQFSVQIELVNSNGGPVYNHGLHGYWARNVQTNEYYYPSNQEGDLFEDLPTGTYVFGAYNGYFDGASQETVTLDCSIGSGYTVVQLTYWVE